MNRSWRLSWRSAPVIAACLLAPGATCEGGDGFGTPFTPGGDTCARSDYDLDGLVPTVAFVSSTCASGDGQAPVYPSLEAAVAAAEAGTVLLLDRDVDGGATLSKGLTLVGREDGTTVITPLGKAPWGLNVTADDTVTLRDLTVRDAAGTGVRVEGKEAVLERVKVEDTRASGGAGGHGIEAVDGATLRLVDCTVAASEGVGVLAQDALAIIEGTFLEGNEGGAIAIIEGTFDPGDGGGVSIIEGTFDPGQPHEVRGCTVNDNALFGVALYGTSAELEGVTVSGTKATAAGAGGDGVLIVAPPAGSTRKAQVSLDASTVVSGSDRAGVLVAGSSDTEAIIEGTFLKASVAGTVEGNGAGGVWAQGAGAELGLEEGAIVRDNDYVGAAATAGAVLRVQGATIEKTRALSWTPPSGAQPAGSVGDGVSVSAGAALIVEGGTLRNNARAGIVADAPSTLTFEVSDTSISGGDYGIALQGLTGTEHWALPAVGAEGLAITGTKKAAIGMDAGLTVRDTLCSSPTPHHCVQAP